jgi:hypothetical protein
MRAKPTKKTSRAGVSRRKPAVAPVAEAGPVAAVAAEPSPTPRASLMTGPAIAVGTAAVGILLAAALVFARHPSPSPRLVAVPVTTQLERLEQPELLARPINVAEAVPPDQMPAPLTAFAPVVAVARTHVPKAVAEKPAETPVTTTSSPAEAIPSPVAVAADPIAAAPATSASADATVLPGAVRHVPVTITGCLETSVDEALFRLTDTEGTDAPQARSWRSGFLKKRPAPVALVEFSNPPGFRKYVGRRVVAMGLLTNGELHVRSIQPAGPSCN